MSDIPGVCMACLGSYGNRIEPCGFCADLALLERRAERIAQAWLMDRSPKSIQLGELLVKFATESQPLTVAQQQPDRDAIARIINPIAFTALERSYVVPAAEEFMYMKIAREKADKILSILNAKPANHGTDESRLTRYVADPERAAAFPPAQCKDGAQ